jgi:hypothetical protein
MKDRIGGRWHITLKTMWNGKFEGEKDKVNRRGERENIIRGLRDHKCHVI